VNDRADEGIATSIVAGVSSNLDRPAVMKGLAALGAMPEEKGRGGIVRFRDPNGLGVELKAA